MPTYLYECDNCEEIEIEHSISLVVDICPYCKSNIKRLIAPIAKMRTGKFEFKSSQQLDKTQINDVMKKPDYLADYVGDKIYQESVKPREAMRKELK